MRLLDLYSGCGGMSTGLFLGANMANVDLVTRWAVDFNRYACESLKLNHPETEVSNESAEDFLMLLKEWEKLCQSFSLVGGGDSQFTAHIEEDEGEADNDDDNDGLDEEIFEIDKVLSICYGDPKEIKKRGLYLKISSMIEIEVEMDSDVLAAEAASNVETIVEQIEQIMELENLEERWRIQAEANDEVEKLLSSEIIPSQQVSDI